MFFQLEDVNRRHSVYYDIYNVESWVTTQDSTLSWNYQRGFIAGVTGALLQQSFTNLFSNWKLLASKYEPPSNLREFRSFFNQVTQMETYKLGLKNRSQYALAIGAFDLAPRLVAFRGINNGWQKPFGGFEYQFIRKIPGTFLISVLTAPFGVPFELARRAFYADKTFPQQLQKGYTSYFNALRRIPFEEGPYYLFKQSFPIILRNFFQTFTLFYMFDWLQDKGSFMWRVGDIPYYMAQIPLMALSTWFACAFSYPWGNTITEMVDFWPKEKGGVCTWQGNYRKAATWLWYHEYTTNYYPGFIKNYISRQYIQLFALLYISDSLGMFSYNAPDMFAGAGTNSWEDTFL